MSNSNGSEIVAADIAIISALMVKLELVKDRVGDAVRQARDDGATWVEIAGAVGLSPKMTRKEYATLPPPPGRLEAVLDQFLLTEAEASVNLDGQTQSLEDRYLEEEHEDELAFEAASEAEHEAEFEDAP